MVTVMFNAFCEFHGGREKVEKLEKPDLDLNFNLILIFSFIWSVGGNLFDGMPWNSRQKYSQFIKSKILKVLKMLNIVNMFKIFKDPKHLKDTKDTKYPKDPQDLPDPLDL